MTAPTLNLEEIIDRSPVSPAQVGIITICGLIAMLDGFDTQVISFVAPAIAKDWQVNAASFGPMFGAALLGGMLGALVMGVVSDRYGRKPTLLFAITVFALGSLLTVFTHSVPQLTALRFLTGIGLGGALPSFIALTSEYAPRRLRATLVGAMFCGFPLGAMIGGLISARLIPVFGWHSVFILGGVLPLVILPLFMVYVPESLRFLALNGNPAAIDRVLRRMRPAGTWNGSIAVAHSEHHAPISNLFSAGRAGGTVLLWTILFFSLLLSYLLINWIPILATQMGHGLSSSVLSVVALNFGSIVGCVILSRLADRFRPALVLGIAFALGTLAIASIGRVGASAGALYGVTFIAGMLSIGAQLCTVAFLTTFYEPFLRATGVGWAMGVGRVGAIAGPVLGGVLLTAGVTGGRLFLIAGLTSLAAAVAAVLLEYRVMRARSVQVAPSMTKAS